VLHVRSPTLRQASNSVTGQKYAKLTCLILAPLSQLERGGFIALLQLDGCLKRMHQARLVIFSCTLVLSSVEQTSGPR